VLDHLHRFIIADDVELTDITADTAVIALEGPGAEALLPSVPQKPWPISSTGAPGFRIFIPIGEKDVLIKALESAGAIAATPQDAEAVRLEHARPRYGADLSADHIPHEARLAGAVHFTKGCYIGQEIVERVRSRGRPNRLLTLFEIEGEAPIIRGTKFIADGKEVGEITSSAYSPAERKTLGFGYVRSEFADPGKQVKVGERTATTTARLVETPAAA
jgi:aminomethyltransferase